MVDNSALIERFLEHMKVEKGASAETLRAYRADLKAFFYHLDADIKEIEPAHIRAFMAKSLR